MLPPKAGDIIAFRRLFFTHYALYIGDGMVIHRDKYAGKARVAIAHIGDIPGKISIATDTYSGVGLKRIGTDECIARAMTHIGETKYNVLTENCEHFVTEHRFDNRVSNQVRNLRNVCMMCAIYTCMMMVVFKQ